MLVIPVYRSRDGELHIVMILRQPGGVHGGQVAFPGGKHDPEDETMLDTAIREVREELGLLIDRANVLAELPVVETRTTGYRVFPYVARIQVPGRWQLAEREIAEIIDVKLSDLLGPDGHAKMIERFPTWQRTATGIFLSGRLPSTLGAFLSHLASGHYATYGGRVGCVSRRMVLAIELQG